MERVGCAGVHNLILQPEATITAVSDLVSKQGNDCRQQLPVT